MSTSKNLPPSARKLKKAREEGDVAKSSTLTAALVILVAGFAIIWQLPALVRRLQDSLTKSVLAVGDFDPNYVLIFGSEALYEVAAIVLPLLFLVVLAGFIAEAVQVGFHFSLNNLAFKTSRLNVFSGLKKLIGFREEGSDGLALGIPVEAGKIFSGLLLIGLSAAWAVRRCLGLLITYNYIEAVDVVNVGYYFAMSALSPILCFYLMLGIGGLLWARRKRMQRLQMSVHELRQELKEGEGDAQTKGLRQALHRALSSQGLMQGIRRAKVLVVGKGSSKGRAKPVEFQ